jgi:signal transduction histidine kinase/ligand-binding sensor domain-containing protein
MRLRSMACGGVLAVGWMVVAGWAGGEDFQIRSWHVEDGLPDGNVTALAQTPDGCLWVGTQAGLVRFDGAEFTRIDGLTDPVIAGLLVDRGGALWIVGRSGAVIRRLGARMVMVHAGERNQPMAGDGDADAVTVEPMWHAFNPLAMDATGTVWLLHTDRECLRFHENGAAETVPLDGLPAGAVRGIMADFNGHLGLLKGDRVFGFDAGRWHELAGSGDGSRLQDVMCPANGAGLWVVAETAGSAAAGLRRLGGDGGQLAESLPGLPIPADGRVSALLADSGGRLWLSNWWGGISLRLSDGRWQQLSNPGPLGKCVVTRMLEDRQGGICVGTVGEGLHRISPRVVTMVMPSPGAGEGLVVSACAGPADELWFATGTTGIYRAKGGEVLPHGTVEGPPKVDIHAVLADRTGRVWAGASTGLLTWDVSRFVPVAAIGSPVITLFEDRAGNLWAGAQDGLWRKDETGKWSVIQPQDNAYVDIRGLAEDADGTLWVAGFNSGIWRVTQGRLVPANAELGIARTDLRSVHCDAEGVVWFGALYGGLFRWQGGRLQHFTRADGLADDSIIGITHDARGGLWCSSSNGVFGCAQASLRDHVRGGPPLLCWRLTTADGLGNRGCSGGGQPVITRLGDGSLAVANMVGVAVFQPDVVAHRFPAPAVLVEAVVADGTALGDGAGGIRAPASTRRFDFRYSAPDLAGAALQRFRYRLDPLDRDWLDAGNERTVSYSRLAPGSYQFRVMVGGADGGWHVARQAVGVEVVPQFWQTRWFPPLTAVCAAAGIAAAWIGQQRRRMRQRLELLELSHALDKERARIARDIHDDLGASLTEILMISETESLAAGDGVASRSRLQRIGRKARTLIQSLDEIVWAVGPANDNLPKLADYLCSTSEELCESAGIRCWHEVPAGLPMVPLPVDYRHQVFLAVKEAFNNSLKHSQTTAVWLRLQVCGGRLRIEVQDDGRGFDPATVRPGNGLANIRERIGSVGGVVELRTGGDLGTTLVFDVPLPAAAVPGAEKRLSP